MKKTELEKPGDVWVPTVLEDSGCAVTVGEVNSAVLERSVL